MLAVGRGPGTMPRGQVTAVLQGWLTGEAGWVVHRNYPQTKTIKCELGLVLVYGKKGYLGASTLHSTIPLPSRTENLYLPNRHHLWISPRGPQVKIV